MSRRKKKQASEDMSGTYIERKLTASEMDQYVKELAAYWKQQDKAMNAALIVNPDLRSLFEEVKRKEKTASCSELKGTLEKVRMLMDNKEWEDEPEWMAINHIFVHLRKVFENRCHEMWKEYAGKLSQKYRKEMEEAWYMRQIEPLKEQPSREELRKRRSQLNKAIKYLEKVKKE